MEIIKKYKWWIIWCCCTSLPIIEAVDHYSNERTDYYLLEFAALFAFYNIAIPLLLYIIYSYFKNKKDKKHRKELSNIYPYDRKSYSLSEFSERFGNMYIHTVNIDSQTTELDKCAFKRLLKDDVIISVDKNIKHYTKDMIIKEKENLEVVLQESGDYCLCRKWEAVNF